MNEDRRPPMGFVTNIPKMYPVSLSTIVKIQWLLLLWSPVGSSALSGVRAEELTLDFYVFLSPESIHRHYGLLHSLQKIRLPWGTSTAPAPLNWSWRTFVFPLRVLKTLKESLTPLTSLSSEGWNSLPECLPVIYLEKQRNSFSCYHRWL